MSSEQVSRRTSGTYGVETVGTALQMEWNEFNVPDQVFPTAPSAFWGTCWTQTIGAGSRDVSANQLVIAPVQDGLFGSRPGWDMPPQPPLYVTFHPSAVTDGDRASLKSMRNNLPVVSHRERSRIRQEADEILAESMEGASLQYGFEIQPDGSLKPIVGLQMLSRGAFAVALRDRRGYESRSPKKASKEQVIWRRRMGKLELAGGLAFIAAASLLVPAVSAAGIHFDSQQPLGHGHGTVGPDTGIGNVTSFDVPRVDPALSSVSLQQAGSPIVRPADCPVYTWETFDKTILLYPPGTSFTKDNVNYKVLAAVEMARDVSEAYYMSRAGGALCIVQPADQPGTFLRATTRGNEVTYIEAGSPLQPEQGKYIWLDRSGERNQGVKFIFDHRTNQVTAVIQPGSPVFPASYPDKVPPSVARIKVQPTPVPAATRTPVSAIVNARGETVTPTATNTPIPKVPSGGVDKQAGGGGVDTGLVAAVLGIGASLAAVGSILYARGATRRLEQEQDVLGQEIRGVVTESGRTNAALTELEREHQQTVVTAREARASAARTEGHTANVLKAVGEFFKVGAFMASVAGDAVERSARAETLVEEAARLAREANDRLDERERLGDQMDERINNPPNNP